MFKLDIDTSNFNKAISAIAKYSGAPLADVIEYEAGKVLEKAVQYTPAAKISNIRELMESRQFSTYDPSIYQPTTRAGIAARAKAKRTKNGNLVYFLGNKYPAELWEKIQQRQKESLQRKLLARGLAKKSWWMLAEMLGLSIRVPGFVSKATATTGRDYPENVSAKKMQARGKFGIFCENASPLMASPHVRGRTALQRAISGREKYFRTNFEKGVFYDLKKIAAKYPGMRIG